MRWPPHSPDTESDRERERLMAALVFLSAEHGYRQTTLQLVLDRAGVEAPVFARHFESLDDCFCETFEKFHAEFFARAGAAFGQAEDWRGRMRGIAYAMLDFLKEDLARARFVFIEILFAGPRAQLLREQGMDALCAVIDLGRSELQDPESVPPERATIVGGGIYSRIRMELAAKAEHPENWDDMVPEMMYAVVEPYLGSEVALEELTIPRPAPASNY